MKPPPWPDDASAKDPSGMDARPAKDVHVLVVEDDERQRKVVVRILRELLDIHGVPVHDAADVAGAREACKAWRPDTLALMVVDWRLPDGTAQDVLEAAVATGADLHVVVLTTESTTVPAHDVWTVHAKPFRLQGLRVLLSDIVHGWRAQHSAALQERAADRGIQCEVEVSHVKVHGDLDLFSRVFYNLLSNAIASTPDGGAIRLELEHPQGRAQVRVRHTGRGLAPDEVGLLFAHFSQAHRPRGEERPGLGFFVTKAIVEAQGGRIWVEGADHDRRIGFSLPIPRDAGSPGSGL